MKKILIVLVALIIILLAFIVLKPSKVAAPVEQVPITTVPHNEGNKDDLVSFSITAGQSVSGKQTVTGVVKGGYFFEGNIGVNILDTQKKMLRAGHGTATDDWMTAGPVAFKADIDFTALPKGAAFIEIHNDNASDLPQNDKSILIPIVIK